MMHGVQPQNFDVHNFGELCWYTTFSRHVLCPTMTFILWILCSNSLSLFYRLFSIALSSNECKWLSPSAKHTISAVLLLQWLNQWNRSTLHQGEKNQRITLIPIIRPPKPKPRNHEQKNQEITIDNSTWNWSTRTSICLFSILYNISCVSNTENYSLFLGKLDQKNGDINKREVSDFSRIFFIPFKPNILENHTQNALLKVLYFCRLIPWKQLTGY